MDFPYLDSVLFLFRFGASFALIFMLCGPYHLHFCIIVLIPLAGTVSETVIECCMYLAFYFHGAVEIYNGEPLSRNSVRESCFPTKYLIELKKIHVPGVLDLPYIPSASV